MMRRSAMIAAATTTTAIISAITVSVYFSFPVCWLLNHFLLATQLILALNKEVGKNKEAVLAALPPHPPFVSTLVNTYADDCAPSLAKKVNDLNDQC